MLGFEARLVVLIFWVFISVFLAALMLYKKLPKETNLLEYIDKFYIILERKLNRKSRGAYIVRLRGAIVTIVLILSACIFSYLAYYLFSWFGTKWPRLFLESLLLAIVVRPAIIIQVVSEVARLLNSKKLEEAKAELSQATAVDISQYDAFSVSRMSVETLARNLYDEIFAPVIWYFLGGLYLMLSFQVIRIIACDERLHSPATKEFLYIPQLLHKVFNLFPATVAATVSSYASYCIPNGRTVKKLSEIVKTPDPEDALVAASAEIFGLTLGGPRTINGLYIEKPWYGTGTLEADVGTIRRAVLHYIATFAIVLVLIGFMAFLGVAQ